jgi:hypothetical protein
MINVYISRIGDMKNKYPLLYEQQVNKNFGSTLTWEEIQLKDRKTFTQFYGDLKEAVELYESDIDVIKLARLIQSSRSGIGGSAITAFTCEFCKNTDTWSNTATPGICSSCSEKMAIYLAKNHKEMLKN